MRTLLAAIVLVLTFAPASQGWAQSLEDGRQAYFERDFDRAFKVGEPLARRD